MAPARRSGTTQAPRISEGPEFWAPTHDWFANSFEQPTPAQVAAWQAIAAGDHTLLIAPTGSGKTLAAFLLALDRLSQQPQNDRPPISVVYVSPLKALAVDVERNLTAPLRGIELAAQRLGLPAPQIRVGVRTGDTSASQRRRHLSQPPDLMITTPESLFLMLSGQQATTLAGVELVIVDEIHALAGTKRGAHLALSLERLEALGQPDSPLQRVGLSATVRPPELVAQFLGGDRPVTIVQPPSHKQFHLSVQVPVADLTELTLPPDPVTGEREPNQSIWPFVEEQVLDLIEPHRTTLCFVNSRRVAERLTSHLNERWAQRLGAEPSPATVPAEVMAQSGNGTGRTDHDRRALARAHHGSVSKDLRAQIEADLKSGQLACVVATSSLELGIDMGSVDQVIQISSPPSVASGLQRIGRAGHQVGATSKGVIVPTHRGDLIESCVVVDRMLAGEIERIHQISNPLDVLAQHLVSMCLLAPVTSEAAYGVVTRADSYRQLPRSAFTATLDMLTGRYPSEDWAELRPRLIWDRGTDLLTARPGAQRLVTTSAGTIPDRGLFGVFIAGEGQGRRVGELDEEMVYESRVGDVFTLGTSTWRIEDITPHQVLVTPAPGQPGRLPFWHGDANSRPLELGLALGEFTDRLQANPDQRSELLAARGMSEWAIDNTLDHLDAQQRATSVVPGGRHVVVERCRDECGDWRVLVHAAWGSAVLAPWAMVIEAKARERYGVHARATATNDGVIIRIPDLDRTPPGLDLLDTDPDDVRDLVMAEVFGSALFAARFRECAARSLLLPRRDPRRRNPLWQQRMRSAQLLQVATRHPDFPIVLETLRECLDDVFDLTGLIDRLQAIQARTVRLIEVETDLPSPYARNLLFGYVGEFIYDSDQPLAERTLVAAGIDQTLLAELLGRTGDADSLLDPASGQQVEAELQRLAEGFQADSAEAAWDIVRTIGPLTPDEFRRRCRPDSEPWIEQLLTGHRLARVSVNGEPMLVVTEDLALVRDALGVPVPPGYSAPPPGSAQTAVARLVERWVKTHCGTEASDLDARWCLPAGTTERVLHQLSSGDESGLQRLDDRWWTTEVIARVRRRALARLRAGVEPVAPAKFARFTHQWHEMGRGREGLLTAVEQLAGVPLPASMLEPLVLPARVSDYHPGLLDEALSAGEVVWTGRGAIGRSDGWVQLWPADLCLADPCLTDPCLTDPCLADPSSADRGDSGLSDLARLMWQRTRAGGAWTMAELADSQVGSEVADALWELVWSGLLRSTSFSPVRDLARRGALKTPRPARPKRQLITRPPRTPLLGGVGGRWTRVQPTTIDAAERDLLAASVLLNRHGILTRGAVNNEPLFSHFGAAYRILAALEERGGVRRGYFVEGLGASQFALPGAVDQVRADNDDAHCRLLAACDPANPYGAALPWPASPGHRPTRRAGALVVLRQGELVCHLERGARTLQAFATDAEVLVDALGTIASAVQHATLSPLTIATVNAQPALTHGEAREWFEQAGFVMTPQGYKIRAHPAKAGGSA